MDTPVVQKGWIRRDDDSIILTEEATDSALLFVVPMIGVVGSKDDKDEVTFLLNTANLGDVGGENFETITDRIAKETPSWEHVTFTDGRVKERLGRMLYADDEIIAEALADSGTYYRSFDNLEAFHTDYAETSAEVPS